jgi:hypothetical protein
MAQALTGSFSATGQSQSFMPTGLNDFGERDHAFNVSIWGTFVGTVQLERSFDNGTTWLALTQNGSQVYKWTAQASEIADETEAGVLYRLNCTAFTSGPINYRLSQ